MTVSYNLCVSTSKPWALFRLLIRWRGSIWKLVLIELIVFLLAFNTITAIRLFLLPSSARREMDQFIHWLNPIDRYKISIPIEFMLGFFVTAVVQRWIHLIHHIGFIDSVALVVAGYVRGGSQRCRMMRRNMVRYCCLGQVLIYRDISLMVRKRFPTLDTVVASGFMLPHEKKHFDATFSTKPKYWLPFQWALSLAHKARKANSIEADINYTNVFDAITSFRGDLAELLRYDWVPLPIAYPQLVYVAVHVHFLLCLISKQEVDTPFKFSHWLPFPTLIQFTFYMGWTKVAMVLLNPFGEDDDDFESNSLLDRNFKIGMDIVDTAHDDPPELLRDMFWDEEVDPLYSEESARGCGDEDKLVGSAGHIRVPESVSKIVMVTLKGHREDHEQPPNSPQQLKRRISVVDVPSSERRRSGSIFRRGNKLSSATSISEATPGGAMCTPDVMYSPTPIFQSEDENKYSPTRFSFQDSFTNLTFKGDNGKLPEQASRPTSHILQDVREEEESKEDNSSLSNQRLTCEMEANLRL